jgi:outer membrane protein
MKSIQSCVALVCAFSLASPGTYAQNAPPSDVQTGSRFGSLIGKYQGRQIAPINLSNSGRLEQLVRAGTLYLSLQDAIAAALENNIDIAIQRYLPQLAEQDLLRAKSGGFIRGISTNVVSGSSGAAGSGVTGATTSGGSGSAVGSGGSGPSGASGSGGSGSTGNNAVATSNNGPNLYSLDPVLVGSVGFGHTTSPQTTSFLTGTNTLVQQSKNANFSITQGFLSGTVGQLSFTNGWLNTNNIRNDFNPSTQAGLELYVAQHLLQGFGFAVNNRNIRIAKNNLQVADLVFKQQVMATVANVIGLYWDLVAFNEDVAVKRQALALAQKLYNDNKKQVEIGTLAPIEIVRAEAEVAAREQDLTTAETNVLQQETILKNAISRNGVASPTIAEVRIVPTDKIQLPQVEAVEPIQDLVAKALQNRPDVTQTSIQLDSARIALKGTKNGLLPSLDAFVDFRNRGQAGAVNAIPNIDPTTGRLLPRNPDAFFVGGYGTALGQVFGRNFPDYSAGFQLNIPLRNRAAQADYATAQLNLRQGELQSQRQINSVRVEVQNALIALQQARARYQAAEKNRVLQEQTLDAEQKKYSLGASTVYMVIQAQRDLAVAEGSRVQALDAYARARTELDFATGSILEANGIQIDEAFRGVVSRPPDPLPVLDNSGRASTPGIATPMAAVPKSTSK